MANTPELETRFGESHYRERATLDWDDVTLATHCVDCFPGNCPLYVFTKDGKVVREELAGNLEQVEVGVPDMNPLGCQKGVAWSKQLDAPDRILHPLRRVGERGEGRWEEISWDEALAEVADAVIDAITEIGPEAVVHEGSPEIGAVAPAVRFMNGLGATVLDVNGSINDFWAGLHLVFGKFYFAPSVDDLFHSDCVIIWHSNPAYTWNGAYHFIVESRYSGADVVLVSPDVNPTHSHVDLHVPVSFGSDAALALSMCHVILEEQLADLDFVRTQTDLALLVRCDTGEFLRESDRLEGGRDDRFFMAHPADGIVAADAGCLLLDFDPELESRLRADLVDGTVVDVEPLFARMRRHLAAYAPEEASAMCGANPEVIRTLARKVAAGKTRIILGAGVTKYYHGDLMTRAIALLLGLTGNWGRKGTGLSGWATGLFDGQTIAMAKTRPGIEGADAVISAFESTAESLRQIDPTLTGDLAKTELWRAMGARAALVPPAFFWYWHAGYRPRWNTPEWNDPDMPRDFDALFDEALEDGWPGMKERMGPDRPPRVLIEIAGNMLRRARGGETLLLETLWPQLEKIVVVDYRMSQTAQHADLVLPATQHYEKTTFNMPTPWTMFLAMSDAAAEPAGESRSEWEMLAELCRVIAERAAARGLDSYKDGEGSVRRYENLWDAFTLDGTLVDDETVADEMVRDAVTAGSLPPGTSLDTFREKGWSRYSNWGVMPMATGQSSPFPDGETHAPLRNHVEQGDPYPTLTRRAQFLIEHPWFMESGEDLPVHKDPPGMGGDHPFKLSSGHNRWSIHAMNTTNPVLLETHRGKPFVLISTVDAAEIGIADDATVRIHNDAGEFFVAARLSPAQRPGGLTVYNGFEDFMFPGGRGANEVEPGMVKWLHFATGYGHLTYAPTEWQPVPSDRCILVDCEPVDGPPD